MPYIKPVVRDSIDMGQPPSNCGELNYKFYTVALEYFKNFGGKYQQLNDIMGALEGCKLELYRKVAAPYEDDKILENGDIK